MGDYSNRHEKRRRIESNKGLLEGLKQTPAFKKFREANLEKVQAEVEAKRQDGAYYLTPESYDPEKRVVIGFLTTSAGLALAERISHLEIFQERRQDLGPKSRSFNKPYNEAATKAKIEKLDWELKGGSEHIAKLKEEIIYVAQKIKKYDFSVLIEGPSGTGKELIARAISKYSGREKFLAINCAALPGPLFESELFGYVRGAFTGAVTNKHGLIEGLEGGILFLDEIGDLTPEHQGKILRLLQEKTYIPVGATKEKRINDIRIIAATNKDLAKEIKGERFREDLYYRLNHRIIQTIPLKDRRVDIIFLFHYFLSERKLTINSRAKALLYSYDFLGNVRELESLLYSADDYQYIRYALDTIVANNIGKNFSVIMANRANFYMEMGNYPESFPDLDELSWQETQLLTAINFFDAIDDVDRNYRDWERETQRYEILILWGKTDYSKEDICRILGIRTNLLTPHIFKAKFGLDLPPRAEIRAEMEGFDTLRLYPDFIMKYPWPP
jgi:DNA-binding NtrC family response regulator